MQPIGRNLLPQTASTNDKGELTIGGVSLLDIAKEFGTPAFVYDAAHLKAKCAEAVEAFPDGVAYASKAFTCTAMIKIALDAGMSIDVASGGEMQTSIAAGAPPSKIVFHGNNKSAAELTAAVQLGIGTIVIDSFDEIERLAKIIDTLKPTDKVSCIVRVTPGIEAHTHKYIMTGQDDSKFGFSLSGGDAQRAVDAMKRISGVKVRGMHSHIGSQIFDVEPFERLAEIVKQFIIDNDLRELCVGGGLGVPYVEGEQAPSIAEWGSAVRQAIAAANFPLEVKVTAEPGRSIAAAAAITIYEVGTIKDVPGIRTYLSVDGGMSDNPRPILYDSGYEAFLPRVPDAPRTKTVTIVGKHCESGDIVVQDAIIPEDTKVGDIIATPVTGAYGHSMASNYNRVPRPPVIFVENGQAQEVVRRETIDDILRLDVAFTS